MNADEEQKRFTDQLPNPARRKILHRAAATVVGTGLAVVPSTAKSGDGIDSAIELFIRAFAESYDRTKAPDTEKPVTPPPKNPDNKPSLFAPQNLYSTDYGEADVTFLSVPQFSSTAPQQAYQKIIDSLSQAPGAKKGNELANGIRLFAKGQSAKSLPKGLIDFQKDTKLTPQEKAQALGMLVLLFRSGATSGNTPDNETRAQEGAQAIVRLGKICPEITQILYNWNKPQPTKIDKAGTPLPKKQFEFSHAKGNLGEFLASEIQYYNPHAVNNPKESNYTLYDYDKGFSKPLLGLVEQGLSGIATGKAQR